MDTFRDLVNRDTCWNHSRFWNTYIPNAQPRRDDRRSDQAKQAPDPQFNPNKILILAAAT